MRIKRIHHLTIAVRDAEQARETFEALFSSASDEPREIDAFGVRTRDVAIGDDVLQLAAPRGPGSPIMRFLERKGEGFYNLALEVDDLDAAVAELGERGIKVSEPIEATPGVRSAFVTMAATHGLSIQLVETVETAEAVEAKTPLDLTPDEWSDDG
ncbi:MAG: VOC family protein [Dehalococcoidia bacterium]